MVRRPGLFRESLPRERKPDVPALCLLVELSGCLTLLDKT